MIKDLNKSMLKSRVLEACIKKQQSLIDNFKERIKALLENQGLGNEDEYDNNTLSQQGQATDEVTALTEALALANEEMNYLQQLKTNEAKLQLIAGPGAIVVTDKAAFYVSVSAEQFVADGDTFIGISIKSPIYQSMKGLSVGSAFQHNGAVYKIVDIF